MNAVGGALQESIPLVYGGAAAVAVAFFRQAAGVRARIGHAIGAVGFAVGTIGYPLFWVAPEIVGVILAVLFPTFGFVWAIVVGVRGLVRKCARDA